MKVTPIGKSFGKYKPGDEFDLPDKAAKLFIKVKKLQEVVRSDVPALGYQTRMMTAVPVAEASPAVAATAKVSDEEAPYGYKADGTPRLRPAYNVRKAED